MKRLICLILALMMVMTLFTACGSQKSQDSSTTSAIESTASQSTAPTEEEPAWKTKQIELVTWDYPEEGPDKESILERFKKFEELYPNIKIDHKLFKPKAGSNDRVEFTTAMAGGNGPDVYGATPYVIMKQWVKQGFFYPLDEYLNEWEETQYLQPSGMKIGTVDGKRYGVISLLTPFVLGYRVDKFKEAGLDPNTPPKTWDEYVKAAQALTNESKGQYGISLMGSSIADWWFQFYVWQAGGEVTTVENDGTVKLHITEQPCIDALQFYKDLKWKYNVIQKNALMEFGDQATDFALGKAAMIIFTPEWLPWWTSLGMKQEEMAISPMPAGPAGVNTVSVSGAFYTINAGISKEKRDAAWEYIKFMSSREFIIQKFKDMAAANVKYPTIPIYTNLNIKDYVKDIPDSWVTAFNEAAKSSREEYSMIEEIRPYFSAAIQAVLVSQNADPKTELEKAAEIIQKEVIDKYNNSLKK